MTPYDAMMAELLDHAAALLTVGGPLTVGEILSAARRGGWYPVSLEHPGTALGRNMVEDGRFAYDAPTRRWRLVEEEHATVSNDPAELRAEVARLRVALVEETARRLYAEARFAGTTVICGTEGWASAPEALRKQYRERAATLVRGRQKGPVARPAAPHAEEGGAREP